MERVHLDFLGPFPVTKRNNSYILMMVDQFTKWVECIPLSTQTADVTAQAAVNEFFTRFGYPFEIFTDQGPNFDSQLFKELCNRMQIYKARTTPYRPSSNGQVERFNRTLMDAVRSTHAQWDIYIPQLAGGNEICNKSQYGVHTKHVDVGKGGKPANRSVISHSN